MGVRDSEVLLTSALSQTHPEQLTGGLVGVHWKTELVGGHPCSVYEPSVRNLHQYVVLFLHDLDLRGLDSMPRLVDQCERYGLPAICPLTGRSWWTDRICAEFDPLLTAEKYLLNHVLSYIEQQWLAAPPQIALLGVGMGGQGALRLSYKFPNRFPIVSAISPTVDYQKRMESPEDEEPLFDMYEDPEQARQDTALLHIHPLNWPRHQFFCCDPTDYQRADSADRLRMKLASLGVPFSADLDTQVGSQRLSYADAVATQAMGFLATALDRERLRRAQE